METKTCDNYHTEKIIQGKQMTKFDALIMAIEALAFQGEDPELKANVNKAIKILEAIASEVNENDQNHQTF